MTDTEFRKEVLARFDQIDSRLDGITAELDSITAEMTLMRGALERFGFMGKAPTPPSAGSGHRPGLSMTAKGPDSA